jgi:hypothetical protein
MKAKVTYHHYTQLEVPAVEIWRSCKRSTILVFDEATQQIVRRYVQPEHLSERIEDAPVDSLVA